MGIVGVDCWWVLRNLRGELMNLVVGLERIHARIEVAALHFHSEMFQQFLNL